jgi:hypothetical protein
MLVHSFCYTYILKVGVTCPSETSVSFQWTTQRYIPVGGNLSDRKFSGFFIKFATKLSSFSVSSTENTVTWFLASDFIGALTVVWQRAITFVHWDTTSIVARWNVFTEQLPRNAWSKSVTILSPIWGCVTIRRGLDSMIGFIALIHWTRNYNYNTTADFHTRKQSTLSHLSLLPVSTW